ncbi:MAG: hypothetical protein JWR08_2012, partial [Enterovirga sp.]|nr:hypothetical protein [Enterovirga sp.]
AGAPSGEAASARAAAQSDNAPAPRADGPQTAEAPGAAAVKSVAIAPAEQSAAAPPAAAITPAPPVEAAPPGRAASTLPNPPPVQAPVSRARPPLRQSPRTTASLGPALEQPAPQRRARQTAEAPEVPSQFRPAAVPSGSAPSVRAYRFVGQAGRPDPSGATIVTVRVR